jgi:serine/threonine protein kinase
LSDFGIARNVDDISGRTTTTMTVGTVAYCAPEQLMGEHIDGRADRYALAGSATSSRDHNCFPLQLRGRHQPPLQWRVD